MIAPLERTFRINQDVGDVLDVADLPLAAADLEQRIVRGAGGVGRIEQQHAPEACPEAGGELQFSPLMSWTMQLPGQVRSEGTTRPTPLPLRVGAKHSTCSGPS